LTTLQTLAEHNIWAVPVYDGKTNLFEGVVDILDIVTFITNKLDTFTQNDPITRNQVIDEMYQQPAETIMAISERNFWTTVREESPIDLIFFKLSKRDIHRVIVLNPDENKVKALVTQIDIIRWTLHHLQLILGNQVPSGGEGKPGVMGSTVGEASWKHNKIPIVKDFATKNLITFPSTAKVFDVLLAFYNHKISAVPILDANTGKLKFTMSAMDIKGILAAPDKLFDLVNEDIGSFLIKSKSIGPGGEKRRLDKLWTCTMDEDIITIMKRLDQADVHRLWVVDDSKKPIGVVSLSEVIYAIDTSLQ